MPARTVYRGISNRFAGPESQNSQCLRWLSTTLARVPVPPMPHLQPSLHAPISLGCCLVRWRAGRKSKLLSSFFYPGPDRDHWHRQPIPPEIAGIANGSFKQKEPPEIMGRGFVVRSLEAALWAFHRSDSFREGALRAVNLGGDADTTGAIYGQLAGVYYGVDAIPRNWIERLALRELISEKAAALFDLSNT
jgi:hypothetical protein